MLVQVLLLLILVSAADCFSLVPASMRTTKLQAPARLSCSNTRVVPSWRMQFSDWNPQEISKELREQTDSNLASMRQVRQSWRRR